MRGMSGDEERPSQRSWSPQDAPSLRVRSIPEAEGKGMNSPPRVQIIESASVQRLQSAEVCLTLFGEISSVTT